MSEGAPRSDTQARTVEHHRGVRADLRCAPPPLTGAELISADLGLSPGLLAWWALRRVHRGGVATSGDQYLDHGRLSLNYLTRTLEELTEAGLLTLAEEDPWGLRRLSLTETGRAQYARLTARRVRLPVPEPEFPAQTPAGRRLSCPDPPSAPGGQPDPDNIMIGTPTEMPDPDPRDGVPDIAGWPPGAASDAHCATPGPSATSHPRQ